MFTSRATRRRRRSASVPRAALGRGLSRRLGVEAMEGRLMLAATALEFAPVELQAAQFSLVGAQVDAPADPAVWVAKLSEGGFIADRISFAAAASGENAALLGSGLSSDALNNLIQSSDVVTSNADGMSRGWVFVNWLDSQQGGIQPVAVVVADSHADIQPVLEPILSQYYTNQADSDEGGSISIPTILASSELGSGREAGRQVAMASLAAENSGDSPPTARLAAAPSADRGIAGEWARAMVFELAGGEPEGGGQSATRDRSERSSTSAVDPSPQVGEPLSSVPAHRAAGHEVAQRTGAARIRDAAVEVNSAALQADASDRLSGTMVGGLDSLASASQSAGNLGSRAGQGTRAAILPDIAFERAFEQIGSSTKAVIQSPADDSWRRSFGAAPLLMVLALERIAAGNSRRANRDAAAVAPWRPRRSRDAAIDAERA